jgi:hypothetical protein
MSSSMVNDGLTAPALHRTQDGLAQAQVMPPLPSGRNFIIRLPNRQSKGCFPIQ